MGVLTRPIQRRDGSEARIPADFSDDLQNSAQGICAARVSLIDTAAVRQPAPRVLFNLTRTELLVGTGQRVARRCLHLRPHKTFISSNNSGSYSGIPSAWATVSATWRKEPSIR